MFIIHAKVMNYEIHKFLFPLQMTSSVLKHNLKHNIFKFYLKKWITRNLMALAN